MDGDQLADFYWIDHILAAERMVRRFKIDSKYAGKLYL
jgi:hypothetical protein